MTRSLLLFPLLLAHLLASAAQQIPYCQRLTGIRSCVECLNKKCFYCNHRTSPIWTGTATSPVLSECRPHTLGNTACKDIDPQCAACERTPTFSANKCIRCKPQYGVVDGKCVLVVGSGGAVLSNCRKASMNADCAACHEDATCLRCHPTIKPFLSPTNTVWLDAGYPETQCTTRTDIAKHARAIAGVDLSATNALAAFCRELDTDFRCAACAFWTSSEPRGYGPLKTADPNRIDCVPNDGKVVKDIITGKEVLSTKAQPIGRNGCYMRRPYMQYCLQCTDDGRKCLAVKGGQKYGCTGGRSIDQSGLCSLNCKGMFGIACKACNSQSCLELDTAYASGR